MRKQVLRSGGFNYDADKRSLETGVAADRMQHPHLTIQSAREETDINFIVKKFGLTGQFKPPARLPSYGDFTGVEDFHSAMNAIRTAEEGFMDLPSNIRTRFGNDPQLYLEFVTNPENKEEMYKMGLAKRPPPELKPTAPMSVNQEVSDDGKGTGSAGVKRSAQAVGGSKGAAKASEGES